MDDLRHLLLPVIAAYGYAIAVLPILRIRGRFGTAVSTCAAIGVLWGPLLISADRIVLRALASIACTEVMFKMIDFARACRQGATRLTSGDYVRFLIPFPFFLIVIHDRGRLLPPDRSRYRDVVRALAGASLFAACFWLLHLISDIATIRSCFALDHAVKLAIFVVAIESLSQSAFGLERLTGFDTKPPIQFAFLSRTVAEYWIRYNNRVHVWYLYNVFQPAGGRRAPLRGILLTFFVSAVHHELMFAVATSRLDGYQFTFFMLQAPAVLVSRRLERFARSTGTAGKFTVQALTVVWFYATSVFFFHGVNRVFTFYYASDPWLP